MGLSVTPALFCMLCLRPIARASPHNANEYDANYELEHGVRNVLQDAVFGLVTRIRSRCLHPGCGIVHDTLHNSALELSLAFPNGHRKQEGLRMTLQDMWENHFSEMKVDTKIDACEGCTSGAMRQSFLEGEPPLLIIKLERGWQINDKPSGRLSRGKFQTRVDFPEALSFMRTGTYTLCGVVSHYGSGVDEGYYNTHCRMAKVGETQVAGQPAYCLFECQKEPTALLCSWEELSKRETQESVFVLLYARVQGEVSKGIAGSRVTPNKRGKDTNEILEYG